MRIAQVKLILLFCFCSQLLLGYDYSLTNEEGLKDTYYSQVIPFLQENSETGFLNYKDSKDREIRISYRHAKAKNPFGTLVLVHGLGERHEKYNEFIYNLVQNGLNVYALTLRGHPGSTPTQKDNNSLYVEDFSDYVEDLAAFIDQVVSDEDQQEDFFLYAHSMGSAVSALYIYSIIPVSLKLSSFPRLCLPLT